tara:strand:+ start:451 stop:591 length:141 start_codon:yes stop_codon:yes gene_type:complete
MKDENVGEKNFRYITKEFKFIINPIAPITAKIESFVEIIFLRILVI